MWLVFGLFVLLPTAAHAQAPVERSSEIVTVGGKEYYMHHVKQGQTLFGISQAYQVSVEQIEALNPEVKGGLQAGSVIGIPVIAEPVGNEVVETPSEPSANYGQPTAKPQPDPGLTAGGTYVVQRGEDLYDIAKKFGSKESSSFVNGIINKVADIIDIKNKKL